MYRPPAFCCVHAPYILHSLSAPYFVVINNSCYKHNTIAEQSATERSGLPSRPKNQLLHPSTCSTVASMCSVMRSETPRRQATATIATTTKGMMEAHARLYARAYTLWLASSTVCGTPVKFPAVMRVIMSSSAPAETRAGA